MSSSHRRGRPSLVNLRSRQLGSLYRCIEVASRSDGEGQGEARAVVEDDFHHFRVTIRARKGRVSEAFSTAPRHPTVLCPTAGSRLVDLIGMPLSAVSAAVMQRTDARTQCTHMIDLAGLAVSALARGIARRNYAVEVPDRVDGRTHAQLHRDGEIVLQWEVDGQTIIGPKPFAGIGIGSGFTGWARDNLSLDEAEAALVLRRGVFISGGRGIDLDAPGRATGPMGGCWVWQPDRAPLATRMVGSTLDFTGRREVLARDDQAWLAFVEA